MPSCVRARLQMKRGRIVAGCLTVLLVGTPACRGKPESDVKPEELKAAMERLKPTVTDTERDDFIQQGLADEGSAAFTRDRRVGFDGSNVTDFDIEAMTTCVERAFQRWLNPPLPSTRAEYALLYSLYLEEVECLEAAGLEVEPPSLDAYIDGHGAWIPFGDLKVEPPRVAELEERCPQDPWQYVDDLDLAS